VLPDFATVVPLTATGEIIMVRGYKSAYRTDISHNVAREPFVTAAAL
jgi:hypothetical protein